MRSRRGEKRIFFPWEGTGGIRRWLGLTRAGPFLVALGLIAFVWIVGARERHQAGVRTTRVRLLDVRRAVDRYMAEHEGQCPQNLRQVVDYGAFDTTPTDAWGRPLRLICPSGRPGYDYELMSDGPDGKPGGLDRIE